jgi:hypothetical protein
MAVSLRLGSEVGLGTKYLDMGSDGTELLVRERAKLVNVLVRDDKDIGIVPGNLEHAILEESILVLQKASGKAWHWKEGQQ